MTTMIDRTTAPPPGPPRPYHFPRVTRKRLDNGLEVLIAENHAAPLVSARALVRSGADHDIAEVAGLASLTADLLDEGSGARDGVQIAEDLGLLGGTIGTGADWDASYISLDALSRNAAPALEIFADVVRRAALPSAPLGRVRRPRPRAGGEDVRVRRAPRAPPARRAGARAQRAPHGALAAARGPRRHRREA